VTQFVAISRTVAQRIACCYDRASEVVYPPVDTRFYTPSNEPRDDYYLCVSALAPYKRLDLAIAACNQLRRRLLIVGDGPQRRKLAALAGPTVTLAGWRSNEEIRQHLRRCRALLFPGHEDFGIVPLEAQACGTPVVALGHGGATETVIAASSQSPGSGVFFDEPTAESLIEAIQSLERNPEQCSPKVAREQSLRFTAERYERDLLAVLERVSRSWSRRDPAHAERAMGPHFGRQRARQAA
jgi:glycosyltransferase involved in cell wall biosynthesis